MSAEAKALLEAIGELTAKIESLCETMEPIVARLRAEDDSREKEALSFREWCDERARNYKEISDICAKIVHNDMIARGE